MDLKQKVLDTVDMYKRADFRVFTRPGLIFTIVLLIVFLSFNLFKYTANLPGISEPIKVLSFDPLTIAVAILSAVITMAIWWFIGTTYAPKVGYYLTEKKLANILITKGDIHYFEKVDREDLRIIPGTVIAKFINLLISWFAVTVFLLGFLLFLFPGGDSSAKLVSFFQPSDFLVLLFKYIIVFLLAPILMSITVPIPWMLLDTRLKAYSSGAKINSFVGHAVQVRLNSIFAVGGIVTLVIQNLKPDVIILIIVFIFVFLSFPSMLMVSLYNMLFQVQYYESFLREIPVPFGTTSVQMEVKFQKEDINNSEKTENTESQDSTSNSS